MSADAFRFEVVSVDDSGAQQKHKGLGYAGEELKDVPLHGFFGFAFNPPPGSHGVAFSPQGRADLAFLLNVEHGNYRPANLPEGASGLYDTAGLKVTLKPGQGVTIAGLDGPASIGGGDGQMTYLGGVGPSDGGSYAPVMTAAGPSSVVFAKL